MSVHKLSPEQYTMQIRGIEQINTLLNNLDLPKVGDHYGDQSEQVELAATCVPASLQVVGTQKEEEAHNSRVHSGVENGIEGQEQHQDISHRALTGLLVPNPTNEVQMACLGMTANREDMRIILI